MKYLTLLVVFLAWSCLATAKESQVMVAVDGNLDVIRLEYHGAINEDFMKRLTKQTQLRELDLSAAELADGGLLGELKKLRKLYLTGSKMSAADLAFIGRLTRLEVLGLSDTDITAEPEKSDQREQLGPLTHCQHLRHLLVDRTMLNGEPLSVETLRNLRDDSPLQVLLTFDPAPVFGLAP